MPENDKFASGWVAIDWSVWNGTTSEHCFDRRREFDGDQLTPLPAYQGPVIRVDENAPKSGATLDVQAIRDVTRRIIDDR